MATIVPVSNAFLMNEKVHINEKSENKLIPKVEPLVIEPKILMVVTSF
ncbi:unnamed protein product [Acidithrix sp. C25]|nr:unnamed protein product [Acidithrix sp. C25]